MLLNRRNFAALAALALSGCGFTPLYGGAQGTNASATLETIKVENIPERTGQILRQTLQQDLYRNGQPVQELYSLSVGYAITTTSEGIQADSSSSRGRITATANWSLSPIGNPSKVLTSGTATALNAVNVIDQQYFAGTLEMQAVNQQLANEISAQITAQLMAWFRLHPGS